MRSSYHLVADQLDRRMIHNKDHVCPNCGPKTHRNVRHQISFEGRYPSAAASHGLLSFILAFLHECGERDPYGEDMSVVNEPGVGRIVFGRYPVSDFHGTSGILSGGGLKGTTNGCPLNSPRQ